MKADTQWLLPELARQTKSYGIYANEIGIILFKLPIFRFLDHLSPRISIYAPKRYSMPHFVELTIGKKHGLLKIRAYYNSQTAKLFYKGYIGSRQVCYCDTIESAINESLKYNS